MRINVFVANATGLSRRAADRTVAEGRVEINGKPVVLGQTVATGDNVTLDKRAITPPVKTITIMLNKPVGYVCSRDGQGSRTIYNLLPPHLRKLKPIGRLDKDSSGLLLMTDDGQLSYQLTHPSFKKTKVYEVRLDHPLSSEDAGMISEDGVQLHDGISKFDLEPLDTKGFIWKVTMTEGKNRQIRRTFGSLSYTVTRLHRQNFGGYELGRLKSGRFEIIQTSNRTSS